MHESKRILDKENKILSAVAHFAWILIISLAIIFIMDELFHGSNLGKIVMLTMVGTYIVFSFARKFWNEKHTKKMLNTIDITVTLLGAVLLIFISTKYRYNDMDIIGAASGNAGIAGSQPHIFILYFGLILLIAGAIRIYVVSKQPNIILKQDQ